MGDYSLLAEELGRTQTVKDVQRAYQQIQEAKRQLAVRLKQARQDHQKYEAEVHVFIDDMLQITGLTFRHKLFWELVGMALDKRLRRHQMPVDDNGGFPQGW